MKVPENAHLAAARPLLRQLLDALLSEFRYASVLAVDSTSRQYQCSMAGLVAGESQMLTSCGYVVRVFDDAGCCEYSFNEITEAAIPQIVAKLRTRLRPIADALPEGVTPGDFIVPEEAAFTLNESTEFDCAPGERSDKDILALLQEIHELGLSYDSRMLECGASFNYRIVSKLFLSKEKDMTQNIMWTNGAIFAMAKEGESIKSTFKGYSKLGGIELLNEMKSGCEDVCRTAVDLLSAEPIPPGEYECVCTPEVTGMIVHEAFGHGVEMDMFVKDRALAQQYVGKQVASELVTMHDSACAVDQCASYFFDDEGTPAQDTLVIDKGILVSGYADAQSAAHLGVSPTGNGRRESFERKAYTRMTNTWFEAGNSTPEEMIASVRDGLLLDNPSSGMEDPKNWGIQCMVTFAREIKDGKLTGRIFSPIVLTGYVPDLLKSITMMSDSVELSGSGFCGKGYKEWVKVSDGGPWIKATIRLG